MPTSDYTPDVSQVARKIISRTRDRYGVLVGTFNSDTLPTDTQTIAIVDDVITEVADAIGDDIPNGYFDDAKEVVSLLAAMQVELDFYPEQVNSNRSTYTQLQGRYTDALAKLQHSLSGDNPLTPGVDPTTPATRPQWSFPASPMTTLDERW